MTARKILVREDERTVSKRFLPPSPETGWSLLGVLGSVFALVAGADILLAWFPTNFGNAEWEFGTVTASLESFPLLAVGLALLLGSSVARGAGRVVQMVSGLFLVLAVAIAAAGVMYALRVPVALETVTDPVPRSGLKRAILKTVAQAVLYSLAFAWIAIKGWRHAASR